MATPIKNNLPPASQQWVRDIERRMADLERQNQLLQITANKNATQLGAIGEALAGARSGSVVASGQQTNAGRSGTGSGSFYIDIPRPGWAQGASILIAASFQSHDESGGAVWSATLDTDVYRSSSGTRTLLASNVTEIRAFVGVGGVGYAADSTSNVYATGPLDPAVDAISIRGRWGHTSMPTDILSSSLWRVSTLVLWHATANLE